MSETPTFGRYAEIPYDQMTPEQQEGYKAMLEAVSYTHLTLPTILRV